MAESRRETKGQTMADTTGQTAPWTVKAMPVHIREKAVKYARMDGVTVAEWLTRAVETQANRQDGNQIIPPGVPQAPAPSALDLGTVAVALQAMAAAAGAGLPVAKAAAREAVAVMRLQMRFARGLPARQTRLKIGQTMSQDGED